MKIYIEVNQDIAAYRSQSCACIFGQQNLGGKVVLACRWCMNHTGGVWTQTTESRHCNMPSKRHDNDQISLSDYLALGMLENEASALLPG
jgi:hypothetical protein